MKFTRPRFHTSWNNFLFGAGWFTSYDAANVAWHCIALQFAFWGVVIQWRKT